MNTWIRAWHASDVSFKTTLVLDRTHIRVQKSPSSFCLSQFWQAMKFFNVEGQAMKFFRLQDNILTLITLSFFSLNFFVHLFLYLIYLTAFVAGIIYNWIPVQYMERGMCSCRIICAVNHHLHWYSFIRFFFLAVLSTPLYFLILGHSRPRR